MREKFLLMYVLWSEQISDKLQFFIIDIIQFSLCYQKKALILAEISYKSMKLILCIAWCLFNKP
ncbi:hypothetical protein C1637_19320 [Chryseobacterium lactis]|uniref:Uncharacterized protein n=1 Tax=Chryseobacterium lactis TaxID=1241981 RepID=A0A3G6RK59_CHRLC|nr:hypothetical protein EG342_15505 [Chryseobacterium lactis]AZB03579.1 hypothetical protein EG341_06375 [Chryseobacterium lactis]PNW11915.1 hypothetical protein C1637_19320 [Chryseobacterium lactis]